MIQRVQIKRGTSKEAHFYGPLVCYPSKILSGARTWRNLNDINVSKYEPTGGVLDGAAQLTGIGDKALSRAN
jgi:hypothetical protein